VWLLSFWGFVVVAAVDVVVGVVVLVVFDDATSIYICVYIMYMYMGVEGHLVVSLRRVAVGSAFCLVVV